ncbi:transposable element Tcb1 transposase [Trichonephila clavipes]|nr:transposable element Tcb1 transposase [Trichonephila clavipes]
MALMDPAATPRIIAQQIQSVTHHSVSTRTTRRHLQQSGMSARCPLLRLLLNGNYRRLRCQLCDEWWTWKTEWKDNVFTDESLFCLKHHDGRIRVWRHRGSKDFPCMPAMQCSTGFIGAFDVLYRAREKLYLGESNDAV